MDSFATRMDKKQSRHVVFVMYTCKALGVFYRLDFGGVGCEYSL